MTRRRPTTNPPATTRVAIYTRQSVADDKEFGSVQAQREAVEAYIVSQRGQGWVALAEPYDDHGFSGATTDRPAFQRLLADIEAGKIDVVAVYKIDRLSRSLADFGRLVELLDRHGVTFVSVTQQFSTANSMGKFTMNILMSFAEFERDTISERTRDKMLATRRKGMWTGGRVVLGFRVEDKHYFLTLTRPRPCARSSPSTRSADRCSPRSRNSTVGTSRTSPASRSPRTR